MLCHEERKSVCHTTSVFPKTENEQVCDTVNLLYNISKPSLQSTSSSAMAERLHDACSSKGAGYFEAKFYVEGLRFAQISMDH